jgi:transposase
MTLHPIEQWKIPAQTVEIARAAFPKGNAYMKMYDELGQLYLDNDFNELFPVRVGQSAMSPAQLALITVMQFAEGLTDRQAAEAVRARIDWKYVLGLNLTDPGFDFSVLSEFRSRLSNSGHSNQLLDLMLSHFQIEKLIKTRGKQRTDSTHILATIRQLNRLELVGETLRSVLNDLAVMAPMWLKKVVTQDWFDRYSSRLEEYRLPTGQEKRKELALIIGMDGFHLLNAIDIEAVFNPSLKLFESVEILRLVWLQQYTFVNETLEWREPQKTGLPPNKILIQSPYDIEARNRTKRDINWTGYTAHLTETCDDNSPNLITNVETTPATTSDGEVVPIIQKDLAQKDLLPSQQILDTTYIDAENIEVSQANYQIELNRPVPPDPSWQAKAANGFDISCFTVDWDKQQVLCPLGQQSRSWRPRIDNAGNQVIEIHFDRKTCAACTLRSDCTRAKTAPRMLHLKPELMHKTLQERRRYQKTNEFKEAYALRAGIEGTISQAARSFDLRRSRYCGLAKTHLQNIAIATATNLSRLIAWWNQKPKIRSRSSAFAKLAPN